MKCVILDVKTDIRDTFGGITVVEDGGELYRWNGVDLEAEFGSHVGVQKVASCSRVNEDGDGCGGNGAM